MTAPAEINAIVAHLDAALGELLAARVAASQALPEPAMPEGALDGALRGHEGYLAARGGFSAALAAVQALVAEPDRRRVLDLEAAVNALVVQACEASWALAWTAAAPRRQP